MSRVLSNKITLGKRVTNTARAGKGGRYVTRGRGPLEDFYGGG